MDHIFKGENKECFISYINFPLFKYLKYPESLNPKMLVSASNLWRLFVTLAEVENAKIKHAFSWILL